MSQTLPTSWAMAAARAAAYPAALISAFLFKNQSIAAVNVVAGAFMVLLVVNIRNA